MTRVGITGQSGFIGTHLYNTLGLFPEEFVRVPFKDEFFQSDEELRSFMKQCDVIVHLAAINRNPDPKELYELNLKMVNQLICSMVAENVKPYVIFSSSTQEERDNEYGKSKLEGRKLFENWAKNESSSFTGMVIPNVYGPFCRPSYNSFVATFCYKLTHGEKPEILQDSSVNLIYVDSLCKHIIYKIKEKANRRTDFIERDEVSCDFDKKVSEILNLLYDYKKLYYDNGFIPKLIDQNEINLFNTFRSYIDYKSYFPVKLLKHSDSRGLFVETLKMGTGGQVSFSTTFKEITRGNHYHTRKIERFTVIRGDARIQLRRIGTDEVLDFDLNGNEPSYVDIPVWYTHNITNTGDEELYTQFWINEWYNSEDGDTFFEKV
jgi:UDP-2-acetamido-2,6-beta-L-arabino-hexul-4-ose reductase